MKKWTWWRRYINSKPWSTTSTRDRRQRTNHHSLLKWSPTKSNPFAMKFIHSNSPTKNSSERNQLLAILKPIHRSSHNIISHTNLFIYSIHTATKFLEQIIPSIFHCKIPSIFFLPEPNLKWLKKGKLSHSHHKSNSPLMDKKWQF